MSQVSGPPAERIADWVRDARTRTFELVADLSDEQFRVPLLDIINPFQWEIGHVAWFQERWVLRHSAGRDPWRPSVDAVYDSIAIPHDTRWYLVLPGRDETIEYLEAVRDRVVDRLREGEPTPQERYLQLLSIFHEDMHDEAFTYTRQTLSYPAPELGNCRTQSPDDPGAGGLDGDAEVPGGTYHLGASRGDGFVFDNEQWAHPVEVTPFAIARAPVTQEAFARFVDDGGYRRRELWDRDGWEWRLSTDAEHPVYFRRDSDGGWSRRRFDRRVALEPHRPVIHVNAFEAGAYCRWAGRRLPSEEEWEVAAAAEPSPNGGTLAPSGTRYPWGDAAPNPALANLDSRALDTLDAAALPDGDSAFGCRQMIGNVWEWTSTDFRPYPGFEPGPYREYSEPWFGTHRVLRGGCWATRSRMVHNGWRNFYTPDRRDVFAGFRTCRVDR